MRLDLSKFRAAPMASLSWRATPRLCSSVPNAVIKMTSAAGCSVRTRRTMALAGETARDRAPPSSAALARVVPDRPRVAVRDDHRARDVPRSATSEAPPESAPPRGRMAPASAPTSQEAP